MTPTWFITGTDTEIGKTWCTLALLHHLNVKGVQVAGMKPIAAGCNYTRNGWRNEDALQIAEYSAIKAPYEEINPYALPKPMAPHLAAEHVQQRISIETIQQAHQQLCNKSDLVIAEGAGGWRVPLNESESMKDLVKHLNAKVILVVGVRLGCINHALLTAESIINDGCELVGWVANHLDPKFDARSSIDTISSHIKAPLLAELPCLAYEDIPLLAENFEGIRRYLVH